VEQRYGASAIEPKPSIQAKKHLQATRGAWFLALKLVSRGNLKLVGIYLFWFVKNFLVSVLGLPVGRPGALDSYGRCLLSPPHQRFGIAFVKQMVVKKLDAAVEKLQLIVTRHPRQTNSRNPSECLDIDCWNLTSSAYCKLIPRSERVGVIGPRYVLLSAVRDCFQKPLHPRFRSAYSALPELDHSPA